MIEEGKDDKEVSKGKPLQTRLESALGVNTEISGKVPARRSGDAGKRLVKADRNGTRVNHNQQKNRKGSCAHVYQL